MGTQSSWSAEDKLFLQKHYASMPLSEIAQHLQRTEKAVRSKAKVLKVQRGGRHVWSRSEEDYLRASYADTHTDEIARRMALKPGQVYQKASALGLSKAKEFLVKNCGLQKGSKIGEAYRFRKGQVPVNKGARRPGWHSGRMQETQFRKGQRSGMAAKNWVPVGTIKTDSDGYLRIKVREGVYGTEATGFGNVKVWPLYQRYVWEQAYGPIPPGHIVAFRDGDKGNCGLENLELIPRAELARRNRMWTIYPRELAEVMQLNGALKRKLRKGEAHGGE